MTLSIVAIIGAATALFAGTIGLVQNDIKRVLAYSTVSQLGYMRASSTNPNARWSTYSRC